MIARATIVSGACLVACSVGAEPGTGGGGSGTGGATTVSASGGFGTSTQSGGAGTGGGCVGKRSVAEPLPLDLFVMLDQSGSMLQDAGNGDTRWNAVKAAITSFVQAPASDGIGIGLQFFGIGQPLASGCYQETCTTDLDCEALGCGQCLEGSGVCQAPYNPDVDSCDAADYAWAEVPIQLLPGAGPIVAGALGMHAPGTNTPTEPALAGAIDYAQGWATLHPDHTVAVIFATDGDPSECVLDPAVIEGHATAGFGGTPSIQTFVIGVGPSLGALNGIAAAGGTGQAFLVDFDPMAEEQLLAALNAIRQAALPCNYLLPDPPQGQDLNLGEVNVSYQPGGGGPEQTIPYVGDAAQCPPSGNGWYYDDAATPTEILLCQSTCDTLAADLNAELDIVLGCKTIVP